MALAALCVIVFLGGWATGRWDLGVEHADGFRTRLHGLRLLALCLCLVFAGGLYLHTTPAASRLLGPAIVELQ